MFVQNLDVGSGLSVLLQLNGLDGRDLVCRELGLSESALNRNSPVLLELVRRSRQKDEPSVINEVRPTGLVLVLFCCFRKPTINICVCVGRETEVDPS